MAGWGLVEALLASLLLSTGMVFLLKGQAALREYSDFARERAAAAVLAEAQMERLRAELADGAASDAPDASGASGEFAGLADGVTRGTPSAGAPGVLTTGDPHVIPSSTWSALLSVPGSATGAVPPPAPPHGTLSALKSGATSGEMASTSAITEAHPPADTTPFETPSAPPTAAKRSPEGREAMARAAGPLRRVVTEAGSATRGVSPRAAGSHPRPASLARSASLARPDAWPDEAGTTESSWHEDLDSSRYLFRQRRRGDGSGLLQDIDLQLRWQDRLGAWQSLRWPARLAVGDPGTALRALSPQTSGEVALTRARHASIPEAARPLAPGWLAFQPEAGMAVAWLLDARTGWVLGLCELGGRSADDLRAADVADCRSRMVGGGALLLSGEIRFDLRDSPSPSMPASTALPLSVVLRLSGPPASPAPPHCVSNAAVAVARGLDAVRYHCLVYPRSRDQRWSGRSELSGTAADPRLYRVCRYSADHDHDGRISNPEHPADYLDVDGPLTQQNFLVIRAGLSCPTGLPADPAAGRLLDMGTQAHQPPD